MRRTRALSVSLLMMAALFACIKLFTYQYVLGDDPTTGVALRALPALDSGPSLLADGDRVLIADENGFIGEDVYGAFSHAGWLVAVAASLALAWRLRADRGEHQARGAS